MRPPGRHPVTFRDRADAGRRLAETIAALGLAHPIVLGLPRGGVPVAAEVAGALGCRLDVWVARKVGAPGQPELGIGAVAEGRGAVIDRASVRDLGVSDDRLDALVAGEEAELHRRVATYRGGRELPDLGGADVVVVDDGLATGVTAEAALRGLRSVGARHLTLAVPVGAPDAVDRLRTVADGVVCLHAPARFRSVGEWYDLFDQTGDAEVVSLLARAGPGHA